MDHEHKCKTIKLKKKKKNFRAQKKEFWLGKNTH